MLGQVTERFAESKEEKARRQGVRSTAEALAAVPAREAPAKAAGAGPEKLPPGWSVEKVAHNKALPAQLADIKDPEQRAEAQRLLSEIKQEAAARQPSKELGKKLEKGLGWETTDRQIRNTAEGIETRSTERRALGAGKPRRARAHKKAQARRAVPGEGRGAGALTTCDIRGHYGRRSTHNGRDTHGGNGGTVGGVEGRGRPGQTRKSHAARPR